MHQPLCHCRRLKAGVTEQLPKGCVALEKLLNISEFQFSHLMEPDDFQGPSAIPFNCQKNSWHYKRHSVGGSCVTRDGIKQMFNMEDVTDGMFWC